MADPADFMKTDFFKNYQTLTQQSWDALTRQLQQQQPNANPFFAPPAPSNPASDTFERTLAGLKGYFDLMQGAAASGSNASATGDWQQQLQQMFGGANQPFSQAFAGIDSTGAEGFAKQWQAWLQAAQQGGFELPGAGRTTPAFGLNREQQMQQQTFANAVMESMQAAARYQSLIQRANAQGMERMQDRLAQHAEPGRQIDSLKALYDLWVDCAEEAYAEIALSDEFRDAYGEMVNSQMHVRQLQQAKTENLCRELGMPTRSEVSSLGERLQQLRRDLRSGHSKSDDAQAKEILELRRELNALKRQLGSGAKKEEGSATSSKAKASVVKKSVSKSTLSKAAVSTKAAPVARRQPAKTASATPRKRK